MCLTYARQQRCSLVRQLAEGYRSVVSWLSCYWAVNSWDGSCLCVLIRSVTLNLSIDTWGVAERGKAAIYRASIMTFIDDVTTGAQAFETHKQFAEGFSPFVCTSYTKTHTKQRLSILNSTQWHPLCLCVILCVSARTSVSMSVCMCITSDSLSNVCCPLVPQTDGSLDHVIRRVQLAIIMSY